MSDGSSFKKIDYSLRPSKNIERKMLVELISRLAVFRPVSQYQYIGFGSVYFTDFALFHRQLGVAPMFSMEKDDEGFARAKFNTPFGCVTVLKGSSTECIPEIPFDRPTVVWLDYDHELCDTVLQDIQAIVARQQKKGDSGVLLLVSLDVETKRLSHPKSISEDEFDEDDWPTEPVAQFRELVGSHYFPSAITPDDLRGGHLAETYRLVVDNSVRSVLAEFKGWKYQQLVNFRYADGAEMATFGGVLFEESSSDFVSQAEFGTLDFVKRDSEYYRIDTPRLTFREIHALACHVDRDECPAEIPIQQEDFHKFKRLYRYFPAFVEAEL